MLMIEANFRGNLHLIFFKLDRFLSDLPKPKSINIKMEKLFNTNLGRLYTYFWNKFTHNFFVIWVVSVACKNNLDM
jgi:hypothetical protein